jgi:predicted transcriptional regulator
MSNPNDKIVLDCIKAYGEQTARSVSQHVELGHEVCRQALMRLKRAKIVSYRSVVPKGKNRCSHFYSLVSDVDVNYERKQQAGTVKLRAYKYIER